MINDFDIIDIIDNKLRGLSRFERAYELFLLRSECRKQSIDNEIKNAKWYRNLYQNLTVLYKKYTKIGLL